MIQPRSIFSVSLKGNLETLRISIPRLLKFYPGSTYYLISRQDDIEYLSANLQFGSRLTIIDENTLISYNDFLQLYKRMNLCSLSKESLRRLPWYYQQILKIIFSLQLEKNSKEHYPIVMFDADSIPLKKIYFFHDENCSISFGSLSEYHLDYFTSLELIFGAFEYPNLGFTTQFFSVTLTEAAYLSRVLKCDHSNAQALAISISQMVMTTVLKAHGTIEGSKFSEQELFGLSNQWLSGSSHSRQKPIFSFRSWVLTGVLTSFQMELLSLLGVGLLTYENRLTFASRKLRMRDFILAAASDLKPQIVKYLSLSSGSHIKR